MQKEKKSVKLIRFYQKHISTRFPRRCRYLPTCSQYMLIAVNKFGAFKGTIAGLKRLFACVPWCRGGVDDVPEKFSDCFRSLRFINYKLLHREYIPPKPYGFPNYADVDKADDKESEKNGSDTVNDANKKSNAEGMSAPSKEARSGENTENRTSENTENRTGENTENRTGEPAENRSNARNDDVLENIITRTRFD